MEMTRASQVPGLDAQSMLRAYYEGVLVPRDFLPARFFEIGRALGVIEGAAAILGGAPADILAQAQSLVKSPPSRVDWPPPGSGAPLLLTSVATLLAEQVHLLRRLYKRFDSVAPTRREFVEEAIKARVESDADSIGDAIALGRAAGIFVGVGTLLDRDAMALYDEFEGAEAELPDEAPRPVEEELKGAPDRLQTSAHGAPAIVRAPTDDVAVEAPHDGSSAAVVKAGSSAGQVAEAHALRTPPHGECAPGRPEQAVTPNDIQRVDELLELLWDILHDHSAFNRTFQDFLGDFDHGEPEEYIEAGFATWAGWAHGFVAGLAQGLGTTPLALARFVWPDLEAGPPPVVPVIRKGTQPTPEPPATSPPCAAPAEEEPGEDDDPQGDGTPATG